MPAVTHLFEPTAPQRKPLACGNFSVPRWKDVMNIIRRGWPVALAGLS
jgi:hypothetical protein